MKKEKTKVTELTPEQEAVRMQVVDLELKARFWKANYELRHYTLESEKINGEYEEFLQRSRDAMMKAIEEARANGKQAEQVSQPMEEVVNG